MDIKTATPAQIDTEIARIMGEIHRHNISADQAESTLARIASVQGTYEAAYRWNSEEEVEKARTALDVATRAMRALRAEQAPLDDEYVARVGWTRYYLVTNSNGHVHASMTCGQCFPTTQYAWLTEQSGMSADDLVDLAGESACTVCFPNAPVETIHRPSRLEAPERKAARQQREAAKAERDAAKVAKALTADGSELVVTYADPWDRARTSTERFKTERSATIWAVDKMFCSRAFGYADHSDAVEQIVAAVAAKHALSTDAVLADFEAKIKAKAKRESVTL